jgi:hypothetical protein
MSIVPLLAAVEFGGSTLGGNAHVGLAAMGAAIGVGLIGMAKLSAVGHGGAATDPGPVARQLRAR